MTYEDSKKLQEQEFKFLDTKDLKPLLTKGRTITDIADDISRLYDSEYEEEDFVLNVIDMCELAEYLSNRYGVQFTERVELVVNNDLSESNKKSLKRKIRFISGTREYSYVEDFTDYLKDLTECGEKITLENCDRYIEPIEVTLRDLPKYNGIHAVFDIFESFSNSYGGCIWLDDCDEDDELIIIFEEYNDIK